MPDTTAPDLRDGPDAVSAAPDLRDRRDLVYSESYPFGVAESYAAAVRGD
jgi:hypothetical protein